MSPTWRRRVAAVIFFGSLVAWPITALTIFREEPQGILGLSWGAIALTAGDIWATTDVRAEQDADEGGES